MQTDPYAPLRMPAPRKAAKAVRVDARRHLMLSSWLTGMMAVGLVAVAMARPAPTAPVATAKAPVQVALR